MVEAREWIWGIIEGFKKNYLLENFRKILTLKIYICHYNNLIIMWTKLIDISQKGITFSPSYFASLRLCVRQKKGFTQRRKDAK